MSTAYREAPPAPPVRPPASRVLPFVYATAFLDLLGFGIVIPLLPLYVRSMGGTAQTVGLILGAFSLTQFVATPLLGRLSDRVGRRRVILVSLFGNAVSMAVYALAVQRNALVLLFASRIVAGATAGNLAACQAAVADVTSSRERTRAMGGIGAAIGLGMALGPALGSLISRLGPAAPPLAAGAAALLDLVGALFFLPETRMFAADEPPATPPIATPGALPKAARRDVRVLLVLVLYFLVFLCMTNIQVALALLVDVRLHWGPHEVGELFALYGVISLVIQGLLIGRLARKFGSLRLLVGGAAMLGAGLVLIALAYHPAALLVGVALMGTGLGICTPALSTVASESAGAANQGAVLGLAQSSGGMARTIGPLLSGFLFAHVATGAPFFSGAIAAALAVLVALALRSRM